MSEKTYLGDGAYVEIEGGMVKLSTENGMSTTNIIYLEAAVLEAFLQWLKGLRAGAKLAGKLP